MYLNPFKVKNYQETCQNNKVIFDNFEPTVFFPLYNIDDKLEI